jgi:large subunit ribosomal protein L7/L12
VEAKVEAKAKEIYDVELVAVNAADKIKIIKAIRETMGLGLKEAKELVEKTPVVLKQAKKDEADALAEALTKVGCNVVVK